MAKNFHKEIHYRRLIWIEKVEGFDNEEEFLKRQKELKVIEKESGNIKEIRIVD